jgi:hypothetical protein
MPFYTETSDMTQVMLLALMLVGSTDAQKLRTWAENMQAHSANYIFGEEWHPSATWEPKLIGTLTSFLRDSSSNTLKQSAARAAALYDGPGGTAAAVPVHEIKKYMSLLLATSRSSNLLLGPGPKNLRLGGMMSFLRRRALTARAPLPWR